ncbi:copper resistance protein B [Parvibaculum sp.]|uniref:copper resistance protein B n=1 Tax=Parvibaculum sp. TaxID=2024848 RepID=UPI00272F8A72|nr:copper resistance protein B [Parvibaculum sp.]MDP1626610.1 copper resistance protein B [Parvibaculum sp.]MDP2150532.1 copper resistance protein B [Parvibaculum sp.]MDP3328885.1 copper resistance protein B [Parvibaculum sp.]
MKKIAPGILALALALPPHAAAQEAHAAHGPDLFHRIQTDLDYTGRHGGLWNWNVDGWIGGDVERLWIRSEGEIEDGDFERAEVQLYYGRNVHPYWDVLVGVRQDFAPRGETYLAAGVTGLAPYFFETEATAFVSTQGDVSARFEQSFELLLTQRLIAEPHVELNLFAQDVPELGAGAGFSTVEAGVQLRYEVTRKFAPYADLVWERDLGETASITRAGGEDVEDTTLRFGVRMWF